MSEIRIGQSALLSAVKSASLAVDSKASIPILANVRLTAADGTLTVQGTDITVTMTVKVPCEGAVDVTVPAKGFCDAVERAYTRKRGRKGKDAVDPTVAVSVEGTSVTVAGDSSAKLYGISAADWPVCASGEGFPVFYQATQLRAAVDYVLPAVSKDESRFHLNGACFAGSDLVATDGHRLHRVSGLPGVDVERIVGKRALTALIKLLKGYNGDVSATFGEVCSFSAGNAVLTVKATDAQFPPYEQVIPGGHHKQIRVACGAFLAALEGARPLTCDTRGVSLEAVADRIVVSADNPERGEFRQEIPGNMTVEPATDTPAHYVAGFNPRYLVDALDAQGDEILTLQAEGEMDPIRVDTLGVGLTTRTAVIMPMRL